MSITRVFRITGLVFAGLLLGACAGKEQIIEPQVVTHAEVDLNDRVRQGAENSADTLRVMTLNMAHARGTGMNQMFQPADRVYQNLDTISLLIQKNSPDVVSLQEADQNSFWNGNFNHVSFLAEKGGFNQSLSGTHVEASGLNYGTALVANLELDDPKSVVFQPSEPAPSKGFVVSTIRWPGKQCVEVDVVSVHLDFASPQVRLEQADELTATLKQRDRPVIVMGDFNSGWKGRASAVQKLVTELDLHTYQPENKALVTFPKFNLRLDWILVSSDIEFKSYQVTEPRVSDHLGLVSELEINRACG